MDCLEYCDDQISCDDYDGFQASCLNRCMSACLPQCNLKKNGLLQGSEANLKLVNNLKATTYTLAGALGFLLLLPVLRYAVHKEVDQDVTVAMIHPNVPDEASFSFIDGELEDGVIDTTMTYG